ncbi:Tumor necrosis factor (ligand) superfamily [Mactra antiquata]
MKQLSKSLDLINLHRISPSEDVNRNIKDNFGTMKYSRTSIECGSPSKSPEVVIFPPRYPRPDQVHSQTERKHAYITVRQDSIMENPNTSEHSMSSSPYIRCETPQYDSVRSVHTTDLNPHSNVNIHGFNVIKHGGDNLHSEPNSLRDLRQPTISRDDVRYDVNSTYSIDKPFINKCTLFILVAMFVVAMTMSVYAVIMLRDLQSKYSDLQNQISNTRISLGQTREELPVCVPCASLQLGPLPEENLDLNKLEHKQENGIATCCAKTSAQMYIMLNLFVKRKHQEACSNEKIKEEEIQEKAASTCNTTGSTDVLPPARSGNISAFLVLNTKQDTPAADQNEPQPIRNWNHELPGAHLTNIYMTQDNSKLVVPESGRYYVYSQVSFLIHYDIDSDNAQEVTQLLHQTVLRYNAIYPLGGSEVLFKGVTTQCWEKQKKYGKYTTYAGASVMLKKGDQIYINASPVGHVYPYYAMTYFGLFKIG